MNYKNTFAINLVCFFLFFLNIGTAQNFEKVVSTENLKGGYLGFSSFVDYNNDGFLDIFVTGLDFIHGDFLNAILYKNNGDKTFTESSIKNIPRVIYGDCSWGDFDNNGTLDLIYSGTTGGSAYNNITKIYKNINNGCEFIEIPNAIPAIKDGTVEWVDVDNDGLLDVFYQGLNSKDEYDSGIFKNNGNETFTKIANVSFYIINGARANLQTNSAKWADFDGDGLKDVITASSTKTEREFVIYKNLGNFKFDKIPFTLPQLSYVSMDVGDINKDGLPDFVFTGSTKFDLMSGDPGTKLYFYTNKGNMNFSNSFTMNNDGAFLSKLKLGDFDNDGFLDLVNYGSGLSYRNTKFYLNNKNDAFSEINKSFPDCYSGGIDFGDYDNDKDLDVLYYGRIENPYDIEITNIYENKNLNIELPTAIILDKGCGCNLKGTFSLNNSVDNVKWDFNDDATGISNTSTLPRPSHTFSKNGTYTVSATYTKGVITDTFFKTFSINGVPIVAEPSDITTCAVNDQFNFHNLKDLQILNGLPSLEYDISYHLSLREAENNSNKLPDLYTIQNATQAIFARVQSKGNPGCYVVKDFAVSVLASPVANAVDDIYMCDFNNDGIELFDLSTIENKLIGNQANVKVQYYDSSNNLVPSPLSSNYTNIILKKDYIKAKVINSNNECFAETNINLIANPLPIANVLPVLIGCDDDNDGISEFFDTSGVQNNVIANQSGMEVTYYDTIGNQLTNPLPNPFTNSIKDTENITVRVTDSKTKCFSETVLTLKTSSKPTIDKPQNLYSCDEGNGFANFDTSLIESQLIGNQSGLRIFYKDANGNNLPSPLPVTFKNMIPNTQTVFVKVENSLNSFCFSETSFDLIVNKLPVIDLKDNYAICELEPSLTISINPNFDSYEWKFKNNEIISITNEAKLIDSGDYTVKVTQIENGISCQKSFPFNLARSLKPTIEKVVYDQFGNNFIEISASGDGNFEYSIDGINFQDSNLFRNIYGGTYIVSVKDKYGCGQDDSEVTILDYPKFFTPNNDGVNDFWQIKGISKYPHAQILIFDRYGKLLKTLNPMDVGWDGKYNNEPMISDDFWFTINLNDEDKSFKGHFSLKR
ncbi:FG-GAP-like repeat-containing protein [Flavobacterium limnophilum]|uniref:FG-GAP-like repeat-containing protein n=1 Tax=Flavobacterium limnophilum TaxID=3003262 RepID=UPI0024827AAE|nr:FG-GAP-like repeat-containing protein [Flavobacterium limnophilum]